MGDPFSLALLDAGRVINELTGFPTVGKYAGKSLRRIWISGREANDLLPFSLSLSLSLYTYIRMCFSVSLVRFSVRPCYNGIPWRVADVCVRRRNDHRCARERVQLIASGKVVCEKFNRSVDRGEEGGLVGIRDGEFCPSFSIFFFFLFSFRGYDCAWESKVRRIFSFFFLFFFCARAVDIFQPIFEEEVK